MKPEQCSETWLAVAVPKIGSNIRKLVAYMRARIRNAFVRATHLCIRGGSRIPTTVVKLVVISNGRMGQGSIFSNIAVRMEKQM